MATVDLSVYSVRCNRLWTRQKSGLLTHNFWDVLDIFPSMSIASNMRSKILYKKEDIIIHITDINTVVTFILFGFFYPFFLELNWISLCEGSSKTFCIYKKKGFK